MHSGLPGQPRQRFVLPAALSLRRHHLFRHAPGRRGWVLLPRDRWWWGCPLPQPGAPALGPAPLPPSLLRGRR